jgi:rhodanese-related sulfurtransferase
MGKIFRVLFFVSFVTSIIGCSTAQQHAEVVVVDADQLIDLHAKGAIVIDVRSAEEVTQGKIPNALHVQLADDMAANMTTIAKDQAVVVYCRSGARSTKASAILQKAGYTTIYNYVGSMNDWSAKGKPVE